MSIQSIPNLIQGVSQQSSQNRRDSQCESQFDCINSPQDGVVARPHCSIIALFAGVDFTGAFFNEIIRGNGENYLTGVKANRPFAYNLADGTLCTITELSSAYSDGYLATDSLHVPRDQWRAQTVEDVTFLVNRNAVPLMDPSILSATRYPEALLFVRQGGRSLGFQVTLTGISPNTNNATSAYETNRADAPDHDAESTTSRIAQRLTNGGALGFSPFLGYPDPAPALDGQNGYSATINGSLIYFTRADHGDFDITTSDGNGDDFMYVFKGKAASFAKLPAHGFDGFVLNVNGDDRAKGLNYYVQYKGAFSTGTWEETVKPATKTTLNPVTMPHALTLTGLNTFTYGSKAWSTRISGDEDSAKDPSFVGKGIRDVFYHENRLGLLVDAGCVWSKTNFPYTFFPDTVQTLLATAPVDIKIISPEQSNGGGGASQLDFVVQTNESLYAWAQRTQFRINSGQDPFKQDTVAAPASTAYEYASGMDPVPLGTFLYFATEAGLWASVRALQFFNGKPQGDTDVTAHLSKYIVAGLRGFVASDTLRHLYAYGDGEPTVLNLYNYLFSNNELAQSAWNKWRIHGGTVLWASIRSSKLRVLQQRPEGAALLEFDLTPKLVDTDTGATYRTRLDFRRSEAQVTSLSYNATTGQTTFVLPYKPTGADVLCVQRADSAGFKRGHVYPTVSVTNYTVVVKGDLTGIQFYVGQRITAERTESRFYVRSDKGVTPFNRLTLNRFYLEVSDTGYTRVEVNVRRQPIMNYAYEGRTLGGSGNEIGGPMQGSEGLDVPVAALSKEASIRLVNDSFLPSYWQSAAYDYTGVGVTNKDPRQIGN